MKSAWGASQPFNFDRQLSYILFTCCCCSLIPMCKGSVLFPSLMDSQFYAGGGGGIITKHMGGGDHE